MTPTSARSAISWAVKSIGGYPAVPATIAAEGDESAAGGPRGHPHRGSYSRSYGPHAGYSITSSARRSTDGGTVSPRADAVRVLTINSKAVAC